MPRLVVQLTETPDTIDSRVTYGEAAPAHGQTRIPADEVAALTAVLKALNAPAYKEADYWPDELAALRDRKYLDEAPDGVRFVPKLTQRIGQDLFGWLFPNRDTMAFYSEAQRDQRTIDVDLRFDPDTRVVDALPWELVHDGRDFLVAGGRGMLTRHLTFSGWAPDCPELAIPRLRVVVIKPRPRSGLAPLDDSEVAAIQAVAGLEVQTLEPPTLKRLGEYVDSLTPTSIPHVIHFDGHGVYGRACQNGHVSGRRAEACETCHSTELEPSPQGYLAWEHTSGEVDMVSAATLANQLGVMTGAANSSFRLVALSACNSATVTGSQSAFDGIAQRLIGQGVPAVIAMQFAVRTEAAADFASRLYRNLAVGRSIVQSVALARNDLRIESGQWYRPVVYLRYRELGAPDTEVEGQFFHMIEEPAATGPEVRPATDTSPPPATTAALVGGINSAMMALALHSGNDPRLQAELRQSTDLFTELRRELDLLGDSKDLHDQLHVLKLRVCAPLEVDFDAPDQTPDVRSLTRAANYDSTLARILDDVASVIRRGNVTNTDTVWIDELKTARRELRQGIDTGDSTYVRFALNTMTPIVDTEPTRIDSQMRELARALQLRRLSELLQAGTASAAVRKSARNQRQLSDGIDALDTITRTLELLTVEHTSWQRLEVRLPPAREQLSRNRRREFEHGWPSLTGELRGLTTNRSDEWSLEIVDAANQVDRAVSLADPRADLEGWFQKVASGVEQRFFALDHELQEFCGEIRKLGGGLDALVEAGQEAAVPV